MKIYHQAGHNTVWNIDSFKSDQTGDGIIFSPVHYPKNKMQDVDTGIKKVSLFDPQFYIPDSQKVKLHSYDFFPEKIAEGFTTTNFEALAHKSASLCLQFQIENSFESIIIPARYFPDLITDYIDKQKTFSVEPFLAEIKQNGIDKKVFVSLPLTVKMTQDKGYRTELLNWITSYPEISGVYILNQIGEATKQISQYENLESHVSFIQDLQQAGLEIIVGYCNTESILLSGINPYALTFGAYENTRNFSIDKFLEDESEKRGPAPRVYIPKLLNWVRYDTVIEIKEDFPQIWEKIYIPTTYMETIFKAGIRPHFTRPELYKHHFFLMSAQLRELAIMNITKRLSSIESMIREADSFYKEIQGAGIIFFDENCGGGHLPTWNRVLRKIRQSW